MLFTASLPSRPANPLLRALFTVLGIAALGLLLVFGFVALLVLLGVGAVALLVGALKRGGAEHKTGNNSVIEGEFVVLDDTQREAERARIP